MAHEIGPPCPGEGECLLVLRADYDIGVLDRVEYARMGRDQPLEALHEPSIIRGEDEHAAVRMQDGGGSGVATAGPVWYSRHNDNCFLGGHIGVVFIATMCRGRCGMLASGKREQCQVK